jgi:DNA repair exonuclease SbcCD nuclease subunit
MKVAIVTDQHFGARNDSPHFLDFYQKFYDNVFFPKIKELGINTLLILGDTFDRRKYVNFYSLQRTKQMFFDKLKDMTIDVYMLAGNHDTYYKNTNDVNSPDLLLKEYPNIIIIDEPHTIDLNGTTVCMMPWICPENYNYSMEYLKNDRSEICMGHFEIEGFQMYRGMPSHEGLPVSLFDKFDMVFSGHYHHKHSNGNIHYLGNPYELTWSDYNDQRGFHIFDIETRELEFVANPYTMFHRITYDDKGGNITEISSQDFKPYKDTYVKVVVVNKTNPYLFDLFMNNLYKASPLDVSIIDDNFENMNSELTEDIVSEAEDTLTILNKYVDNIKTDDIDSGKLKNILKELYVEALNLENS